MSTQFYCSFSAEQARQHGIPRGVIEIHADSIQDAREIATKWFPATKDLPFGGWAEIYTDDELAQRCLLVQENEAIQGSDQRPVPCGRQWKTQESRLLPE